MILNPPFLPTRLFAADRSTLFDHSPLIPMSFQALPGARLDRGFRAGPVSSFLSVAPHQGLDCDPPGAVSAFSRHTVQAFPDRWWLNTAAAQTI